MRSRSSVLSHVLGSNPDIYGYSELHYSYKTIIDLIRIKSNLQRELNYPYEDIYLLDKILHDKFSISKYILRTVKPKVFILVREPYGTLQSIIKMGSITDIEWYKDPIKAMDYYCKRLLTLVGYARYLRRNYYFINSDEIIYDTENTLNNISYWLELKTSLQKEYELFEKSGKPGFGDFSTAIRSGIIQKTHHDNNVSIPTNILETCKHCYETCYDLLSYFSCNSNTITNANRIA